ncbi:MAG: EFR1 family ferrodoxin [Promethearchaeota archaeon]
MSNQGRIPLYYFSGSGNTKYCSELVQRGFQDKNIQVKLIKVKNVKKFPFPDENKMYPAIGLAFPVYEFMIPRIILIWLNQLPSAHHTTPVFIIDTSAGIPCDSAGVAMDLLRKKNYEPLGVLEVPTPTAEPFCSNKYYPIGWAPEIIDRCYSFGLLIAKRLWTEDDRFVNLRLSRFRFKFLTRYAYRYIIKGLASTKASTKGLIKFDTHSCNKCGLCERICPMAAIEISNSSNLINFNRCMYCTTCIRICPTHAIKLSYRGKKKTLSPAKRAPKTIPGYISPGKYIQKIPTKISSRYLKLAIEMIKAYK